MTMKPHLRKRERKFDKQVIDELFVEHIPCLRDAFLTLTTTVHHHYTDKAREYNNIPGVEI